MAATAEARELTAENKARQARIGAEAAARALDTWSLLNLADLDASMAVWLPVYVSQMQAEYATSQRVATTYLTEYRRTEPTTDPGLIVAAEFDLAQAVIAARVSGPLTVKTLIGKGMDPVQAFTSGQLAAAGRAQKLAMAGGRQLVIDSARASRNRIWRRVSDGNPCAFCAMLVVRSITSVNSQAVSFDAHGQCGCTAEEIWEDEDEPTDAEVAFIAAYRRAAAQARAAGEPVVAPHGTRRRDTVLWRMRRNKPAIFSDSSRVTAVRPSVR